MTLTPLDFTLIIGIRAGGKPIPWDTNIGSRMDYITEMLGLTPNLGLGGFVMLIELAKRFERMMF